LTLKPVGMSLPPNPSLLNLEIKIPAISLRTIERPVQARVGAIFRGRAAHSAAPEGIYSATPRP
jgi:hypothetical protein